MGRITRESNVTNLKKQYEKLTGVKQFKVNSLIDLYGRGKFYNINTLRYEINKILSPSGNQQQQMDTYLNTITKYFEPSKQQQKKQTEQADKIKTLVSNIETKIKPRQKTKTYLIDAMLFTREPKKGKRPDFKKYDVPYWCIGLRKYRQFSVKVKTEFPNTLIKQRITDHENDKAEWGRLIKIMLTDEIFEDYFDYKEVKDISLEKAIQILVSIS